MASSQSSPCLGFFGATLRALAYGVAAILVATATAGAQTTYNADEFVDSVGVNLHLHFDRTIYYDNFELVRDRLVELGVRHVRDGLVDTTWQGYYTRHNALGRAGIKGLFIVGPGTATSALEAYPTRMRDAFEGYEGPNELNLSGDPNWVTAARTTMTRLRALGSNPALAGFPVVAPSLTEPRAFTALGDLSASVDRGNMHNYFGGFNPGTSGWGANGYGSIDWNVALARQVSGTKPIFTTETGYWNDDTDGGVPAGVSGKYMPRLVLEQFRKGIERTYIYELADFRQSGASGLSSTYGLLNGDGSPKPAFTALKGLLNLLADRGPAYAVRPLSYTVTGGSSTLRQMVFQKRNGTYYVALWLEEQGYDGSRRTPIVVSPRTVTVTVPSALRFTRTHRWQSDGSVAANATASGSSISLAVSDLLTILEVAGGSSVGSRTLVAPTNVRIVVQ